MTQAILPLRFARRVTSAAFVASLFAPILVSRPAAAQYAYPPPPPPPPAPPPPGSGGYAVYEGGRREAVLHAFDLGIDAEGAVPVSVPTLPDGNRMQGGSGFKVRVGDQIRVSRGFRLTPEGGYAYDHLFTADDFGNAYAWDTSRLFAGLRLGFGTIVVPSIYGHLGVGWRTTADPTVSGNGGLATDVGAAIDLRLWWHLQFGAHAEYATLDTPPYAPQWVAMGLHVDFVL